MMKRLLLCLLTAILVLSALAACDASPITVTADLSLQFTTKPPTTTPPYTTLPDTTIPFTSPPPLTIIDDMWDTDCGLFLHPPFLFGDPEYDLSTLLSDKNCVNQLIDQESLRSEAFTPWSAEEDIASLFDGKVDEYGAHTTQMGGVIAYDNYFYFNLNEPRTLSAYVIVTGFDDALYPERRPVEWTLFATNDPLLPVEEWTVLDYVYDGLIAGGNSVHNGFEIDEEKQGSYQYYCWCIGYTETGAVQASELELYETAS